MLERYERTRHVYLDDLKRIVAQSGYDINLVNTNRTKTIRRCLYLLQKNDLLTEASFAALLKRMFFKPDADDRILETFYQSFQGGALVHFICSMCLTDLDKNNLLTEENFYRLMDVSINVASITYAMNILEQESYRNTTQEKLDILIENHDLANTIAKGLCILQSRYLFNTVNNRNFIIKKIKQYGSNDSEKLMNALGILAEARSPFSTLRFTQENFEFILHQQFADCYPTILNCMEILSREGKFNEETREYLLKNPHHAVTLTKLHDTSPAIYNRSRLDEKIDDLALKACILGQGSRDGDHVFSQFDSTVLANIAYMGTKQDNPNGFFINSRYYLGRHDLDQKTATVTALAAMNKANAPMIMHHYNEVREREEQVRINHIRFRNKSKRIIRFLGVLIGIGIGIDPSIEISHSLLSKTLSNKAVFLLVSISLGLAITSLCAGGAYCLSKKIEDNIINCCSIRV